REQGGHRRYSGRPPMSSLEPAPRLTAPALDAELLRVGAKLREVGRALSQRFLGKEELTRLMLVALAAGEHMLLVGPPGTAKSALVRHLARLIDARTFEYLLTRFSEPSELFGPVDIWAFREGTYVRRTDAMLPETDTAFLDEIRLVHRRLDALLVFPEEFLARYKGLIFQIRSEGVSVSDRRVVKLLKLCAASALLDGRPRVNDSDLFVLKHVWNSLDQAPLLADIVTPVLERHEREHPEERRLRAAPVDLDAVLAELGAVRAILLGGEALSDVQLFSQLRNMQDIKNALLSLGR